MFDGIELHPICEKGNELKFASFNQEKQVLLMSCHLNCPPIFLHEAFRSLDATSLSVPKAPNQGIYGGPFAQRISFDCEWNKCACVCRWISRFMCVHIGMTGDGPIETCIIRITHTILISSSTSLMLLLLWAAQKLKEPLARYSHLSHKFCANQPKRIVNETLMLQLRDPSRFVGVCECVPVCIPYYQYINKYVLKVRKPKTHTGAGAGRRKKEEIRRKSREKVLFLLWLGMLLSWRPAILLLLLLGWRGALGRVISFVSSIFGFRFSFLFAFLRRISFSLSLSVCYLECLRMPHPVSQSHNTA